MTEWNLGFHSNAPCCLRLHVLVNTAQSSKYKISSLFMYCCTSLSAFCSTSRPTNTMLRIPVCHTTLKEKWKVYDKELNAYFNGWNISVGLVTWIDWESTIVFIQSHFTPTGKKTLWVAPLPFGNLPMSDTLTPGNFRDPPRGVWIFSGTTHSLLGFYW